MFFFICVDYKSLVWHSRFLDCFMIYTKYTFIFNNSRRSLTFPPFMLTSSHNAKELLSECLGRAKWREFYHMEISSHNIHWNIERDEKYLQILTVTVISCRQTKKVPLVKLVMKFHFQYTGRDGI
jgi:hypothetical protein